MIPTAIACCLISLFAAAIAYGLSTLPVLIAAVAITAIGLIAGRPQL